MTEGVDGAKRCGGGGQRGVCEWRHGVCGTGATGCVGRGRRSVCDWRHGVCGWRHGVCGCGCVCVCACVCACVCLCVCLSARMGTRHSDLQRLGVFASSLLRGQDFSLFIVRLIFLLRK